MGLTRRRLLQAGGFGLLASTAAPLWLRGSSAQAAGSGAPLLVVVFLRGGADALHLAPPVGDAGYRKLRGSLTLERTLPFASGFDLHPRLDALQPLVDARRLALIPAAGSSQSSRSHFEAQDRMELARSGSLRRGNGWLARALRGVAGESPFAALALAGQLPLALHGSGALALDAGGVSLLRPEARRALAPLYPDSSDPLVSAGRRGLAALAEYERAMGRAPRRGARPHRAGELVAAVDRVLRLEAAGLPLRAVWLESGDWDTHAHQGGVDGRMARSIADLGDALAALDTGLAARRAYSAVVMTEFGRTARPNGSGGSDHGHGGLMLVTGSRVRGGVHGAWPGLVESRLHDARDLPVTTDYRHVLSEVLREHLGEAPAGDVFPGFEASPLGLFETMA